jgi:hypothetical protein
MTIWNFPREIWTMTICQYVNDPAEIYQDIIKTFLKNTSCKALCLLFFLSLVTIRTTTQRQNHFTCHFIVHLVTETIMLNAFFKWFPLGQWPRRKSIIIDLSPEYEAICEKARTWIRALCWVIDKNTEGWKSLATVPLTSLRIRIRVGGLFGKVVTKIFILVNVLCSKVLWIHSNTYLNCLKNFKDLFNSRIRSIKISMADWK